MKIILPIALLIFLISFDAIAHDRENSSPVRGTGTQAIKLSLDSHNSNVQFYQVPGIPRPDGSLIKEVLLSHGILRELSDIIFSYWDNKPSDYASDILWAVSSETNNAGQIARFLVRIGSDGKVQTRIPVNLSSAPEAFAICATHAAWVCGGVVALYNLLSGKKVFESPVPEGVVDVQLTKNRVLFLGRDTIGRVPQDAQPFSHIASGKKGSFAIRPDGACQFVEHSKRSWGGVLDPKTGAVNFIKNLQNGFEVTSFCPMVDKGEGQASPDQNNFLVFGKSSETGNLMIAKGNSLFPGDIMYTNLGPGTFVSNHWNGFGFLGLIQEVDKKKSNDNRNLFTYRVVYTPTTGNNFVVKESAIKEDIEHGREWPQEKVFIYGDKGFVFFNNYSGHNAVEYNLPNLTQRSVKHTSMFSPNTTRSYMVGPLHLKLRTFFEGESAYLFNMSESSVNLTRFPVPYGRHSSNRTVYQNPQSRLFIGVLDALYTIDFSSYLNARGIGAEQRRNVSLSYEEGNILNSSGGSPMILEREEDLKSRQKDNEYYLQVACEARQAQERLQEQIKEMQSKLEEAQHQAEKLKALPQTVESLQRKLEEEQRNKSQLQEIPNALRKSLEEARSENAAMQKKIEQENSKVAILQKEKEALWTLLDAAQKSQNQKQEKLSSSVVSRPASANKKGQKQRPSSASAAAISKPHPVIKGFGSSVARNLTRKSLSPASANKKGQQQRPSNAAAAAAAK